MHSETLPSGNIVTRITTQQELLDNWDFFKEGHEVMCSRSNMRDNAEAYFKSMSMCVHDFPRSFVVILTSKNGKPLGFGAAYDDSRIFYPNHKILFIYAVYSNKKSFKTIPDLMSWGEQFAKSMKYNELQTNTGRFSGAIYRWFEGILGFRRLCVSFRKDV